jgi:ssDNA-binding replication factor A large subunit
MPAAKRISAAEPLSIEHSETKTAEQTYSPLSEEMIEEKKKARLFRDMEKIEKEGEFVQLPW